jgi:hypothetical protein
MADIGRLAAEETYNSGEELVISKPELCSG